MAVPAAPRPTLGCRVQKLALRIDEKIKNLTSIKFLSTHPHYFSGQSLSLNGTLSPARLNLVLLACPPKAQLKVPLQHRTGVLSQGVGEPSLGAHTSLLGHNH